VGWDADLIFIEPAEDLDPTQMPERLGLGPHRLGLDRVLDGFLGREHWAVGRLRGRNGHDLIVALAPGFAAELVYEADEVRDDALLAMTHRGRALVVSLSSGTRGAGFAWYEGGRVRRRGQARADAATIDEGEPVDAESSEAPLDESAIFELTQAFTGQRLDLDDELLQSVLFTELLPPELDGADPTGPTRVRVDPDTDVDAAAREWTRTLAVVVVVFAVLIAMFLAVR
jgi:hypothetical protein